MGNTNNFLLDINYFWQIIEVDLQYMAAWNTFVFLGTKSVTCTKTLLIQLMVKQRVQIELQIDGANQSAILFLQLKVTSFGCSLFK